MPVARGSSAKLPPLAAAYTRHRAALLPLLGDTPVEDQPVGVVAAPVDFAVFLRQQSLHTLWLEVLENCERTESQQDLGEALAGFARVSAAQQLPQRQVLRLVHDKFEQIDLPYFVAKGAHLRQLYYSSPLLRPAVDIDVFVRVADLSRAIRALSDEGFEAQPRTETLSHELKLTRHHGDIDLHWDVFRPGRARPGLLDWLFDHRERFGEFWGLDATASLLMMLVHPAITKYLLSPTSMLIHQVDQARLMACGRVDWDELETALSRFGLKTAAWSSLYVLEMLGGVEAPGRMEARLRPGGVHRWYLRQWIDRAWISKWFVRRWLVAGLFSLALQDSLADARRAMRKLREAKAEAVSLMQELQIRDDM